MTYLEAKEIKPENNHFHYVGVVSVTAHLPIHSHYEKQNNRGRLCGRDSLSIEFVFNGFGIHIYTKQPVEARSEYCLFNDIAICKQQNDFRASSTGSDWLYTVPSWLISAKIYREQ